MKRIWIITRDSVKDWLADDAFTLAAAVSFYAMLSLAPLIVIIVFILGLVWGEAAASGELVAQSREFVGEQGATVIQTVVQQADRPGVASISAIIGLLGLIVAATGLFAQFQYALNRVWNVERKPDAGLWKTVRVRLLAFALVLVIGALLLASVVASAVLTGMANTATEALPFATPWVPHALDAVVSVGVMTLLFALIYKFLPDVEIAWRDVWFGAIVTAVLFVVGKFLIGMYLGYAGVGSAYGAAGSLAVLLVWIYYSVLIILLGAEITQVYARQTGDQIRPADYAKPIHPRPGDQPPPHARPAGG